MLTLKKLFFITLYAFALTAFFSCGHGSISMVILQPFGDIPAKEIEMIKDSAEKIYAIRIIIAKNKDLPAIAYYPQQNRYSADALITDLTKKKPDSVLTVIGITAKDIFTAKGGKKYWGVMGLGTLTNDACIISTYRLHRGTIMPSELTKLAIHELGHNFGLPHCPDKTCIMADAEGHNNFYRETGLCAKCRQKLIDKGFIMVSKPK